MAQVRRICTDDKLDVVDTAHHTPPRRPGDRAVTWLVVAFVCVAVLIVGFTVVRSRNADPAGVEDRPTARPSQGFRVVRVVDGDTLVVVGQDDIELTVRLAGVDAPEKDQPFGDEAARFLEGLLAESVIHLDNVEREKFGRILADAYIGARWVDLEMVQNGWAWVYPESHSRVLREGEAKARAEKVGLWSSESHTPPWEWRKGCN